MFEFNISLIQT